MLRHILYPSASTCGVTTHKNGNWLSMSNSNGKHYRKERITAEPPIETLHLPAGASSAPLVDCSGIPVINTKTNRLRWCGPHCETIV
jgi:hypothetical protein